MMPEPSHSGDFTLREGVSCSASQRTAVLSQILGPALEQPLVLLWRWRKARSQGRFWLWGQWVSHLGHPWLQLHRAWGRAVGRKSLSQGQRVLCTVGEGRRTLAFISAPE